MQLALRMVLSLCCSLLFSFLKENKNKNTHPLDAALALLKKKSIYKEKHSLAIMAPWNNCA